MTRLVTLIALLMATPVAALSPDNVVMACPSDGGGRDVYIYKKYVMFEAGITWPYNGDTKNAVATQTGDYVGWSQAIFEDAAQIEKLAQSKAVLKRPIGRVEKKTSVDFRSFTREVNIRFLDTALKLVAEATERSDCQDITPR